MILIAFICLSNSYQLRKVKLEKIYFQSANQSKHSHTNYAHESQIGSTNFYENPYDEASSKRINDLIWAIQNNKKIRIFSG